MNTFKGDGPNGIPYHKDGFKGYKAIEHYTINTICIHVGYPAYIIPVDQMLEFVIKGK